MGGRSDEPLKRLFSEESFALEITNVFFGRGIFLEEGSSSSPAAFTFIESSFVPYECPALFIILVARKLSSSRESSPGTLMKTAYCSISHLFPLVIFCVVERFIGDCV